MTANCLMSKEVTTSLSSLFGPSKIRPLSYQNFTFICFLCVPYVCHILVKLNYVLFPEIACSFFVFCVFTKTPSPFNLECLCLCLWINKMYCHKKTCYLLLIYKEIKAQRGWVTSPTSHIWSGRTRIQNSRIHVFFHYVFVNIQLMLL